MLAAADLAVGPEVREVIRHARDMHDMFVEVLIANGGGTFANARCVPAVSFRCRSGPDGPASFIAAMGAPRSRTLRPDLYYLLASRPRGP